MTTFEKGAWAWLKDDDECYIPVQAVLAFKAGSAATVRTQDGSERKLSAAQTAEGSAPAGSIAIGMQSTHVPRLPDVVSHVAHLPKSEPKHMERVSGRLRRR